MSVREAITYRLSAAGREWLAKEMSHEPVLAHMIRHNVPLTREAWIQMAYGNEEPEEKDWTPEHESGVPPMLQNWDQFEKKK